MVVYLCSPGMNEVIPVFRSSITNLDSLVTFYQQERTWARRIRAELHEQSQEDVDKLEGPVLSPLPSPASSPLLSSPKLPESPQLSVTLRKKELHVKLATPPWHASPYSLLMLSMYEYITQSRMETCQRIDRLIKNATLPGFLFLMFFFRRYPHRNRIGASGNEESP
ncbi:hypothetical protein EDD18DRAFT_1139935 [Armillaria luteobubalina]|uniref:Uncharacterized protein n=1 Tax=Armillaria luteobubalina TaxID=153913 RepID=A0AA39QG16_9AGAR|nr:hypothetical protein EDD18DRAFT_1139935 [Armillaria luteobubalina]